MEHEKTESEVPGTGIRVSDQSKQILTMADEDFQVHTWDNLKSTISANELEKLIRLPSQLRAYLRWNAEIKAQYGNITNFLLQKRLYWEAEPGSVAEGNPIFLYKNSTPFGDRSDYRILINDWPYALAPGITHICVWLKVRIPIDDIEGDLTSEGRKMVENFIDTTFVKGLGVEGQDKVLWFKNWAKLQSVRGLEHVHVLVRDVDPAKLEAIIEKPHFERT